MTKNKLKPSTAISLFLHLALIVWLILINQSTTFLVPSRSDGITVSLVSMQNQTVSSKVITPKALVLPLKTLEAPADINLKKENIKPLIKEEKVKEEPKTTTPTKTEVKSINKVKNQQKKISVNDLLDNNIADSAVSNRKGVALGGNPNGSSNSDNLVANYADLVIKALRPFVIIPDNINSKAKAIVKVELNPNLSVKSAHLIKSSGNKAYDQNVQDAIWRLKVFPPLPEHASFVNYRILNLTFRPE